jgi:DNA-binding transcriptional LysR family regulator
LHFGRAAQALHVSQPALTKQINRLEEAVGGKLLARNKQGSKLTTFVILSRARSQRLYELTMKLCVQHGFHPRIAQEVSELPTALALVRAGMGILVIPDCFWSPRFTGARMQRLSGRAAAWVMGAVWRKRDTNPALNRFLKLLQTEMHAHL